MDYEHALQYPAQGDWVPRVLVGGGLLLSAGLIYLVGWIATMFLVGIVILPFALLPIFVVNGYYVRVLRETTDGNGRAPGFDDPGELFVDGLKAVGITVAYLSPVIVLAVLGFGAAMGVSIAFPESEVGTFAFMAMAWIGAPILGLVSIGINYVKAAGLANFAYEDDVWAAFDFERVREASFSKTWLIAYFVAWGIGLAGNMLTLGGIGYLLLVGFVVQFYVGTVRHHIFGQAFVESIGETATVSTDPPAGGSDWETVASSDSPPGSVAGDPAPEPTATGEDDDSVRDDW